MRLAAVDCGIRRLGAESGFISLASNSPIMSWPVVPLIRLPLTLVTSSPCERTDASVTSTLIDNVRGELHFESLERQRVVLDGADRVENLQLERGWRKAFLAGGFVFVDDARPVAGPRADNLQLFHRLDRGVALAIELGVQADDHARPQYVLFAIPVTDTLAMGATMPTHCSPLSIIPSVLPRMPTTVPSPLQSSHSILGFSFFWAKEGEAAAIMPRAASKQRRAETRTWQPQAQPSSKTIPLPST